MFATPEDFSVPSIYNEISPEEFAIVLLSGVHVIEKIRSDDSTLGYMDRINDLKSQLNEYRQERDASFGEQFDDIRERIDASKQENNLVIKQHLDMLFCEISSKLRASTEESLNRDKSHRELIRDQLDKRASDMGHYIDRVGELVNRVERVERTTNRTVGFNSSIKGAKNEEKSHHLILQSFGCGIDNSVSSRNFVMHEKKTLSGDHIFTWNDVRIMWEDKDYTSIVGKAEVNKAMRDFENNRDCHVLIFVSANSGIAGHETGNSIDIEMFDGRLVIFISNFANSIDPIGYIRNIIQPIIIGMKPGLLRNSFSASRETEAEAIKIIVDSLNPLIGTIIDQEKNHDTFISEMKVRVMSMKNMLNRTRHAIQQVILSVSGLISREAEAEVGVSNDEGAEAAASEAVAEISRPVRRIKCSRCGIPGHNIKSCPVKDK